jgi:hypothetical protein
MLVEGQDVVRPSRIASRIVNVNVGEADQY